MLCVSIVNHLCAVMAKSLMSKDRNLKQHSKKLKKYILYNVIQYAKLPYMNLILLEGEKLNLRLQI